MLVVVEKSDRGRISHAINNYAEGNKKFMKGHDKNKDRLYLEINVLYGWAKS